MIKVDSNVYSLSGLSNRIKRLNLTSREASRLQEVIMELGSIPIAQLQGRGKIHKTANSDNIYVYKVSRGLRMMLGQQKDGDQEKTVVYDVIRVPQHSLFSGHQKNK